MKFWVSLIALLVASAFAPDAVTQTETSTQKEDNSSTEQTTPAPDPAAAGEKKEETAPVPSAEEKKKEDEGEQDGGTNEAPEPGGDSKSKSADEDEDEDEGAKGGDEKQADNQDDNASSDIRDSKNVKDALDGLQTRLDGHAAKLEQLAVESPAVKATGIRKWTKTMQEDAKAGMDTLRKDHKKFLEYPIKSPQQQHLLQRAKIIEDSALRTVASIKMINSGGKMPFEMPPRDDDESIIPQFRDPPRFDPTEAASRGEKRAMKILDSEDTPEDKIEHFSTDDLPEPEELNPNFADPEKEEVAALPKKNKQKDNKKKKSTTGSALIQQDNSIISPAEDSIDRSVEAALTESKKFLH